MEKRPLIQRLDFLWSGFDKSLGLTVLALVFISIVTFVSSSSGAHVKMICDASAPTYLLTHWVRDRSRGARLPIETVVQKQAAGTAAHADLLKDPQWQAWLDAGKSGELARAAQARAKAQPDDDQAAVALADHGFVVGDVS